MVTIASAAADVVRPHIIFSYTRRADGGVRRGSVSFIARVAAPPPSSSVPTHGKRPAARYQLFALSGPPFSSLKRSRRVGRPRGTRAASRFVFYHFFSTLTLYAQHVMFKHYQRTSRRVETTRRNLLRSVCTRLMGRTRRPAVAGRSRVFFFFFYGCR